MSAITFPTPDGKPAIGFALPSQQPSRKYLFLFHDLWGVTEKVEEQAVNYQKELGEVTVIALDMFEGEKPTNRDEALKLTSGVDRARLAQIIRGALDYTPKDAEIAMMGWCFGGRLALQAGIFANARLAGVVFYYGDPIVEVEELKKLKAPVLGIFGTKDQWINPQKVHAFENAMVAAGRIFIIENYEADHGFASLNSANFDKSSAEDANKKAMDFLRTNLIKYEE